MGTTQLPFASSKSSKLLKEGEESEKRRGRHLAHKHLQNQFSDGHTILRAKIGKVYTAS